MDGWKPNPKLEDVHKTNARKKIPLTLVYDALYAQGQAVLDQHNPCNFHRDAKGYMACTRGRPCCGDCKYLGPDGCTVKALGCKLVLCSAAAKEYPVAKAKLTALADTAKAMGLPLYYHGGMGYHSA